MFAPPALMANLARTLHDPELREHPLSAEAHTRLRHRIWARLTDRSLKEFNASPHLVSFEGLERILALPEKRQLYAYVRSHATQVASEIHALQLLFAVGDGEQAEKLILQRQHQIEPAEYETFSDLANRAFSVQRPLAATVVWRALVDGVLERGISRAERRAADHLRCLRLASLQIMDYRGLPTHDEYEAALRIKHQCKRRFWLMADRDLD